MPKLSHRPPKLRHHKARGLACVTLNGRTIYLGPWGSAESKREYARIIGEWKAGLRGIPQEIPVSDLTVSELLVAYLKWAKEYYGDSREPYEISFAIKPLKTLYGRSRVIEFGPKALAAVRQAMIDDELCRNEVNKRIGRVKRVFKWGVAEELVPPSVFHGLQAVRGLSRGRSKARESEPIKPVHDAFVDAVEPHVTPQIWTMIQLQRLTGMRPGEVAIMRTCDIDTTGAVWTYTPQKHKTAHHGHERRISLGPQAQEILKPWLRTELEAYLFQPAEGLEWFRQKRASERKTPLSCGNRRGTNRARNPKRRPRPFYHVPAYDRAIRQACLKANVPHWHPHQLRHNAATLLRKEYGLDVARVVLGHRSPQITEVYAELDHNKAQQIMGQIG